MAARERRSGAGVFALRFIDDARQGASMVIRHEGSKWILYTKDESRETKAERQERAIEAHKRGG